MVESFLQVREKFKDEEHHKDSGERERARERERERQTTEQSNRSSLNFASIVLKRIREKEERLGGGG